MREQVVAAIDVGSNAVRLKIARLRTAGGLETIHEERDPLRPGEGTFSSGFIQKPVLERLLATLRRYGALCRRFQARIRAVATSALREAKNREVILQRVREEAGFELEVISGQEEARLIALGVLHGRPQRPAVVVDIGGGSTEVIVAYGERPRNLWSIPLGAVQLTELFEVDGVVSDSKLDLIRRYAAQGLAEVIRSPRLPVRFALGCSGTIRTLLTYSGDGARARRDQIHRAVKRLAAMGTYARRLHFDARRAEIIVAGAVILEQTMLRLGLSSVTAVERGLRDGLLVELALQSQAEGPPTLTETTVAIGRRFSFGEDHGRQVAILALILFDTLRTKYRLSDSARAVLEVAALLHDIGNVLGRARHHKHGCYLIRNLQIPGISDRQRELVALTVRFHRRSTPELDHADLRKLPRSEASQIRRLATLLRVADALDHSHQQPVTRIRARLYAGLIRVQVRSRAPIDLELWDVAREAALFRRVFRRRLELVTPRWRTERR